MPWARPSNKRLQPTASRTRGGDPSTLSQSQRQLILVASEDKYRQLTSGLDTKKLAGGLALGSIVLPFIGSYVALAALATSLSSAGKEIRNRIIDEVKQAIARGEIPIPHVSPEEAMLLYRFDVGHPVDGSAYVLNPCRDNHYLVPALANERLVQEKLKAFIELNAGLGAKKIDVLSASMEIKGRKGV